MLSALAAFFILVPAAGAQGEPSGQEEDVLRATLDNGLRVVVVRNALSPVATTVLGYRAGADESPKGFPGTAHALEHMMFRGSPGLSAGQLANIMAAMGGMFNALTRQNATQYFLTVPAGDLEAALRVEAARMRGVLGREELWEQERGAMLQEVARNLSIPEYVLYTRLREALFRGTPYEQDALGTRESLQKTTGSMLKRFHDDWYVPGNAVLVVAGDVQPENALAMVRDLFSDIPSGKVPDRPEVKLKPVEKQTTVRLKTDKPYGSVVAAFRMPGFESPDYAAARVLSDILNNPRGSLYRLVPEGKALDTGFQLDTYPEAGLGYAVALFPEGGDAQALERELKKALSTVAAEGVTADMVDAAKSRAMTDVELEKNSITGLAMAWSTALVVEGRQSPEEMLDAIGKVSVEDVNRVARRYMDFEQTVTGVLVPEPSGRPVRSDGFGGVESFAPENVSPVELPAWAKESLEKLSVPRSAVDPVVSTLPNGIRLIVQPESVSETVSVYGHVRNTPELQVPKGKEGVEQVLASLFSYGTKTLDREEFQRSLDEIGAYASAGTDFTLEVLTDRVDRGMELLADNGLNPALPEKAFETVRRQAAATAAGRLESPEYLAERAVRKAVYPNDDPTLRQATPETLSSLKIDDVRAYYRRVFRPDMTTIVVIGRITPERAHALVGKYFGAWRAPGEPKPDVLLPPVPLNGPSSTRVPNASRVQDSVVLAETLGITRSHPDYYALQLGNHVLGGAFYATRLYRDLRERTGLVYHVSSYFDVDQTRGRYAVEYACDPSNTAQARAIVKCNLLDMRDKPVSPEELRRAKALVLRKIPLSESSVNGIAHGLIHRVRLDLPLDEPTRAAHRYLALSAEQVRDAFARWVRVEDLVEVIEGPVSR